MAKQISRVLHYGKGGYYYSIVPCYSLVDFIGWLRNDVQVKSDSDTIKKSEVREVSTLINQLDESIN